MASRMDKYRSNTTKAIPSRFQKNEHLYEELYTNKIFTGFTEVENNNVLELDDLATNNTTQKREIYQKNKIFTQDDNTRKSLNTQKFYSVNQEENYSEKSHNFNDILSEARKNRSLSDEIEKKKHLKTMEYNILSDLSQEKLKEYRERKQKLSKDEEENLEELIHTITSNSLRKKIDDELLNDLLPTKETETLISKQLLDEIKEETQPESIIQNIENTNEYEMDQSFYTKSMDLSKEDFDLDEDDQSFLEDSKMKFSKKILITLFVVTIIFIIGYIIYYFYIK